jgi:hypothetical protein
LWRAAYFRDYAKDHVKDYAKSPQVTAERAERGKHIISAAKSLKSKPLADTNIAHYLYATSIAGRAGLFASALRHAGKIASSRAQILAESEGFTRLDLRNTLLPWLEKSNLAYVRRLQDGKIDSIESLVLTYDPLLAAVTELYDASDPMPEDRGCVHALAMVSQLPRPQSEVLHALARGISEESARLAIELAKNYHIIAHRSGYGLPEPILFSERIWARFNTKAARSLSPLSPTDRAVLLELVNKAQQYQGIPETLLRNEARKYNGEHILDLGIGIGLLNRTQIQMADGAHRYFLTTPHFYADMGTEFGEDMCDRVKIFLDSIRNGQHFGRTNTGKILSPGKLLSKLLNAGEIGPCTAIGTDYVTSERAGIVKVRRVEQGQSVLELVQRDTVSKVHDIITTGILTSSVHMTPHDVAEGVHFASTEQLRSQVVELPAPVAEAERAIVQKLRES